MIKLEKKNQPTVGIALSGGSALGIAHIGILESLADHGIKIDCITGTSAGALVAACFAFGVPLKQMAETAKSLSWIKLFSFPRSALGLTKNQAIGDMVIKYIGDVNIEDSPIPLAIVATDLGSGEKIVMRQGNVAEAVMASTSIPGIFTPRTWQDRQLVDGVLVENLPLSPLLEFNPDIKIAANLSKWRTFRKPKHFVDVMLNSMDIMTQHQSCSHPIKAEVMIEPHLEDFTASDWNKAAELLAAGYKAATLTAPEILRLLQKQKTSGQNEMPVKTPWYNKLFSWIK